MRLPALPHLSALQWALGASVLVHAVLLTVHFVDPERFDRVFQDTPLEVILVNAKGNEAPTKAQAIAQTNLAGGGELEKGRATSPLPPSPLNATGDTLEETQRQIERLQEQQQLLLAQVREQMSALPRVDGQATPTKLTPEQAREEKRRQLVRTLAEIERRVNEENSRPKKRYVSPSTREEVYALYYDGLRRRIETRGTEDFPEHAGNKLYGELTVILTVNHDGKLLATEIVERSGNALLDRRALAIARAAAPFPRFSAAMRQRADQLVLVTRFRFTREETLEAQVSKN